MAIRGTLKCQTLFVGVARDLMSIREDTTAPAFLQRLKISIGQRGSRIGGCNWLKHPILTQINDTVVQLHFQTLSSCSLFLRVQVKSEYAKLKETLGAVTQERDLALWERNQLQDKLENLEQVLKVRTPALKGALTPVFVTTLCALLSVVVFFFLGS